MTPRDKIIEVMAKALAVNEDDFDLNAEYLHLKALAALTALESSGYIVRPREATEEMQRGAVIALVPDWLAECEEDTAHMEALTSDRAMTAAWDKEQNDE